MAEDDVRFFAQFEDEPEEIPAGEPEPKPRQLPPQSMNTAEDIDF